MNAAARSGLIATFLGCFASVSVAAHQPIWVVERLPALEPSEFSSLLLAEAVHVSNVYYGVDCPIPLTNKPFQILGKGEREPRRHPDSLTRSYNPSGFSIFRDIWDGLQRIWICANATFNRHVLGRGLPRVFYADMDKWNLADFKIRNFGCHGANVSSQFKFSGVASYLVGSDCGPGGYVREAYCCHERDKTNNSQSYLAFVQRNGIIGSFGHAPLFAQIGLIVVLGIGALWGTPAGLVLFLFDDCYGEANRAKCRKIGKYLLAGGIISTIALLSVIFFGI